MGLLMLKHIEAIAIYDRFSFEIPLLKMQRISFIEKDQAKEVEVKRYSPEN